MVAPADPISIKRGQSSEAVLKLATIPGFHVNSNTPSEEYLIPLRLTWTGGPLEAKVIQYPKAETIDVGSQKLSVFTGSFDIYTTFAAPKAVAAGSTAMTGQLHYQACNNRMCFRPMTIEVKLPVNIE